MAVLWQASMSLSIIMGGRLSTQNTPMSSK